VFCYTLRPRPRSTLFPYTTLFRSLQDVPGALGSTVFHDCLSDGERQRRGDAERRELHDDAGELEHDFGQRLTESDHRVLGAAARSEEHTSELQSLRHLVCRLLLEK